MNERLPEAGPVPGAGDLAGDKTNRNSSPHGTEVKIINEEMGSNCGHGGMCIRVIVKVTGEYRPDRTQCNICLGVEHSSQREQRGPQGGQGGMNAGGSSRD